MKHLRLTPLLCLLLILSACREKPVVIRRAFYYWKSASASASEAEVQAMLALRASKLYLKMFEVSRDNVFGAVPVAKTRWCAPPPVPDSIKKEAELVPVVFVNNNVLTGLSASGQDSLADNIVFLTNKYLDRDRARSWRIEELQIDCDWSAANREAYFGLLRALKRKWGRRISCTLRLYPFKYREKMGIPPADRVMLMCYNLLNPLTNPERNTIVELSELQGYLERRRAYPIPFDIALPVYARIQLYRNGRFEQPLRVPDSVIRPLLVGLRPLWYSVGTDTVVDDTYLRSGDLVKYETVSADELARIAALLHEKLPLSDTTTISLFHLDGDNLKRYPFEALEAAYSAFAP